MTLFFQPWREMIGNGCKIEAGLLGTSQIANQRHGPMLFGHHLIAE